MPRSLALTTTLVLTLLPGVSARPQPQIRSVAESGGATLAGELVIEPATLINLGFEWFINEWCAGTDWATSGRPRVRPGDTILVHAGVHHPFLIDYLLELYASWTLRGAAG